MVFPEHRIIIIIIITKYIYNAMHNVFNHQAVVYIFYLHKKKNMGYLQPASQSTNKPCIYKPQAAGILHLICIKSQFFGIHTALYTSDSLMWIQVPSGQIQPLHWFRYVCIILLSRQKTGVRPRMGKLSIFNNIYILNRIWHRTYVRRTYEYISSNQVWSVLKVYREICIDNARI